MFKTIGRKLKSYLVTGMLVLLPVIVSVEVFVWFLRFLDNILRPVLARFMGQYVFGVGIVLMVVVLILVGLGTRNYLGRKLVGLVEAVFDRLPFIRVVYSAVRQLLEPFNTEKGYSLKQVVLVEYPMKDRYSLGFLAKEDAGFAGDRKLVSVFIPTNHLHLGYLVILPESDVVKVDMSVEDALKMAVSCGIVISKPLHIESNTALGEVKW